MAMSRIFSQSLPRSSLCPRSALFSHHRHRSNKTRRAELIEVEIDHASSSQTESPEAAAEVINFGIKKLEDAIHSIIVRRSAPDWLPFLPGYSYWVPSRALATRPSHPAGSLIDAVGKLASSGVISDRAVVRDWRLPIDLLSEDEQMAFTSSKGWPSSAFYIEGTLNIPNNDDQGNNPSDSEDEEE